MARAMVTSSAASLILVVVGFLPAGSAWELNPPNPDPNCPVQWGIVQGPLDFEVMHIATIPWEEEGGGKLYTFVPVMPTLANPLYWHGKVVWQEICTVYAKVVECVEDVEGCTSDED